MHDLEGVEDSHSNDELLSDLGRVVLVQILVVFHELEEVLALDQFGDDVDVSLGLDAFLELEQKGVRDDLHYCTLMAESAGCTL